jgi:hypothetical protein
MVELPAGQLIREAAFYGQRDRFLGLSDCDRRLSPENPKYPSCDY